MADIQSVLNLARIDLNDDSGSRYSDANLLRFANDGLALTYSLRPDLNFGSYGTAFVDLTATSTFPLPLEYRPAIASYIVYRNESGDDEFVISQRAEKDLAEYIKGIGG